MRGRCSTGAQGTSMKTSMESCLQGSRETGWGADMCPGLWPWPLDRVEVLQTQEPSGKTLQEENSRGNLEEGLAFPW